jgi:hypothetical protein
MPVDVAKPSRGFPAGVVGGHATRHEFRSHVVDVKLDLVAHVALDPLTGGIMAEEAPNAGYAIHGVAPRQAAVRTLETAST